MFRRWVAMRDKRTTQALPGLLMLCLVGTVACKKEERPDVHEPGGEIPNPDVPHERLPEQLDTFTETACSVTVPVHVTQCGIVEVPGAPGTDRIIKLSVARVFTNSRNPLDDPIVYLDGGPGGASIPAMQYLHEAMRPISPDRDFIYVDQRGVGTSSPNLQCNEGGEVLDAISACYERLSEDVDLSNFNSINNARDIDLVRQAFGYDQWNLLGISYGTRLALTVMRDYPAGVRSALIDSVVPLHSDLLAEIGRNGYRAFQRVFAACADDPVCAEAYPASMNQLIEVAVRLNETPRDVGMFALTGNDFVSFMFQLLYSPSMIALVPQIVDDAFNGDFSIFEQLSSGGGGGGISFGMHLSLHCAEEVPFTSAEAFDQLDAEVPVELRAALTGRDYLDYCELWPVLPAPGGENEPVVSALPSLVMAGYFDPITPPEFAEAAQMYLSNSSYVLIDNDSHGASLSECGLIIGRSFFDNPTGLPDSACLSDLDDIGFDARLGRAPRRPLVDFIVDEPTEEQIDEALRDLKERLR